jgi:hypothetical protein
MLVHQSEALGNEADEGSIARREETKIEERSEIDGESIWWMARGPTREEHPTLRGRGSVKTHTSGGRL